MMDDYIISCCSTVDSDKQWAEEKGVAVAHFHLYLGDDEYLDDFYQSITPNELFSRMLAGEMSRTSQVNTEEYCELWEPYLKEGKNILHLTLSSGISGTVNSALTAADLLKDRYPERTVRVIDSLCASGGYALLVDKAAELRDSGMGFQELGDWVEEHKLNVLHLVGTTDLTFFIRGGRISKTAGFFGKALNICPYIEVDQNGKLAVLGKVRTKNKVFKKILENMEERAEDGLNYSGKAYIGHSERPEDAILLKKMVAETFPHLAEEPRIYPIGATIGCHTGPGTLTLFCFGKKRDF